MCFAPIYVGHDCLVEFISSMKIHEAMDIIVEGIYQKHYDVQSIKLSHYTLFILKLN